MKDLLLMCSRVGYNQITKNVQKALLLLLDLLWLVCQRVSAALPPPASVPFSGLHGCGAPPLCLCGPPPSGHSSGSALVLQDVVGALEELATRACVACYYILSQLDSLFKNLGSSGNMKSQKERRKKT